MAEGIIDVFEIIDIQHHQGQILVFEVDQIQLLLKMLLEIVAIRESGQGIEISLIIELLFMEFASGNILFYGNEIGNSAGLILDNPFAGAPMLCVCR